MRHFLWFLLVLVFIQTGQSQSLGRQLIGSAGDQAQIEGISLHWSVGESVTGTLNSVSQASTQGFHQPETMESQVIPLPQHWCYFSSYIDQDGRNIASVTGEILPNLRLIKNQVGEVYIPAFGVNQIGPFRVDEAYQANLSNADTLILRGFSVFPEQTAISLNAGWNLLSYIRHEAAPVSELLESLGSQVSLLKSYTGNIYWPAFSFNNVFNLRPGQGYSLRMNNPSAFYYPPNQQLFAKSLVAEPCLRHFPPSSRSGENMSLAIPLNAWAEAPGAGDELGIFNTKGELVGSLVLVQGNMAVSLWGCDEFSPTGLKSDEPFTIRVWNARNNSESEWKVTVWTEGDGSYHPRSLAVVGMIVPVEENQGLTLSPNPARDDLNIRYTPQDERVEIFLSDGGGKHVKSWSFRVKACEPVSQKLALPHLASGQFWLRVVSGNHSQEVGFSIVH